MSEHEKATPRPQHSPLPWRSVYPEGSSQRCAAVASNDHYVTLFIAKGDDVPSTVAMHQANADLIVAAVNSYDASRARIEELEAAEEFLPELKDGSFYDRTKLLKDQLEYATEQVGIRTRALSASRDLIEQMRDALKAEMELHSHAQDVFPCHCTICEQSRGVLAAAEKFLKEGR